MEQCRYFRRLMRVERDPHRLAPVTHETYLCTHPQRRREPLSGAWKGPDDLAPAPSDWIGNTGCRACNPSRPCFTSAEEDGDTRPASWQHLLKERAAGMPE